MDKQKARNWLVVGIALLLLAALLAGCSSGARVGELQTESQSVELGDAKSVQVEVKLGAGDLKVTGGAAKLLEADFNYNVAKLKPIVEYTDGSLVVRQPEVGGLPVLQNISGYRNEWDLRLNNGISTDLSVEMGGGTNNLQLSGLSLTRLNVHIGAGISTIDLSGDWTHDLDVAIDAGAADVTVRLPKEAGVWVKVSSGPHIVDAPGLTKDGDVYTNAAYGASSATLHIDLSAGIGQLHLEIDDAAALNGNS